MCHILGENGGPEIQTFPNKNGRDFYISHCSTTNLDSELKVLRPIGYYSGEHLVPETNVCSSVGRVRLTSSKMSTGLRKA